MKHLIVLFAFVSLVSFQPVASAEEHGDHHGEQQQSRPDHYKAATPESSDEALEILEKNIARIEVLLNKNEVGVLELEKIHKISYSLEAAVEYLIMHQTVKQEPVLNELDEAVQVVHLASEEHEADETRKWFAILKKEYNRVLAFY
jgi:predicted transcriptional regulator